MAMHGGSDVADLPPSTRTPPKVPTCRHASLRSLDFSRERNCRWKPRARVSWILRIAFSVYILRSPYRNRQIILARSTSLISLIVQCRDCARFAQRV
ncbi:hypothetical protein PUN28_016353 [Cardiocondyla obscurior]|uniref:Uncharacterized protein n=1 Tax=Cardiocondyla obscurior TaxID=286306 RepID=A0AAW2EUT8_9HYME